MILRHDPGRPVVIGHRGAPVAAPENTLASFFAAIEAGAGLIEVDVGDGLAVGHPGVAVVGEPLTLADVLDALAATAVGFHIDLKHPRIDHEVAAAVRARGLEERVIVSATWAPPLRRLARELPAVGRAIGYPRDRVGVAKIAWPPAAVRAGASVLRAVMPARARALLRFSRANVLALHHALVSPAVVRAVHGTGGALFAWTVNDPDRVALLAATGVDGIVTDDPEMAIGVLATLKSP